MATIKVLKTKLEDGTEQVVFPKTLPEAIIDPETGKTLDVILDNLNEKIDNIEPGSGGGGGTTYELSRADDTITLTGGDGSSSEVDVSDKVSKSGGIFTGNVEFEGGVSRIDITGQTINIDDLTLSDGSCHIMKYINKTNSGSTNISNVPVGSTPFTLDVELIRWASTTDYISKQVFICSSGKHQFRVRYCTSGTWGDWSTYDFNDIVSKSGDTMTGTLTVEDNIVVEGDLFIPITPEQSVLDNEAPNTNFTAPTAGGWQDNTVCLIEDLPNSKTFLGSYMGGTTEDGISDGWHNIISVRHRNGRGDGANYGMYIRSLMTGVGGLAWNKQYNGNWEGEKTILDNSNYHLYAVPKTGGTFTGDVGFDKGVAFRSVNTMLGDYFVHKMTSGSGSTGYWKFATLNTNGTYIGGYLKLTIDVRGACGDLSIGFNGSSSVDGVAISVIKQTGGLPQIYIIQNGKTFDLYMAKSQWAHATVIRLDYPYYMRERLSITWLDTFVSSLPSGTTSATVYNRLTTENYSTEIPAATQSAVGLMSAADKKKLDGIATGANKITVESSLSSTSTNPVQSKVVHSHMSARLQLAGGTMTGSIKFNNDKGIQDANGNWMLVRSSSVASPLGSIVDKYPTYVGHTSSTSETTYVRGQYLALHGVTLINANKNIGVTSDKRVKTNESLLIDEIDKYNQFFDNLQPRKYNYIRDEEGKAKSIGFFAQEVHQALLDAGLTLEDFGGINIQESFLDGQAEGDDEAVWYQDFYSLAYDEFIPIIVSKIQHLEKMYNDRLEEIENDYNAKLSSLEEKISKVEEAKA